MLVNVTDSENIGNDERVRYKLGPASAMKSNI